MFDIGGGELIVIVLAILILFGPKKIPEIAQMVGKGMQQIRKAQAQFQSQMQDIKQEINTSLEVDNNSVRRRPVREIEIPDAAAGTIEEIPSQNESLDAEKQKDESKENQ